MAARKRKKKAAKKAPRKKTRRGQKALTVQTGTVAKVPPSIRDLEAILEDNRTVAIASAPADVPFTMLRFRNGRAAGTAKVKVRATVTMAGSTTQTQETGGVDPGKTDEVYFTDAVNVTMTTARFYEWTGASWALIATENESTMSTYPNLAMSALYEFMSMNVPTLDLYAQV